MRLPNGILNRISEFTGIPARYLSLYSNVRMRPRPERAILLEKVTSELGFPVSKELWVFGSKEEIKSALMRVPYNKDGGI